MAKGQCEYRDHGGNCRLLSKYDEGDDCLYPTSRTGRCPVVKIEGKATTIYNRVGRFLPETTFGETIKGVIFTTLAGFNGRLAAARKIRALKETEQWSDID